MVETFQPDYGYILQFTIKDVDGTVVDLTGKDVTLEVKDSEGTINTLSGSVTDESAGECEFTITEDFLADVDVYDAQIHIAGSGYIQHTAIFPLDSQAIVGSS